MTKKKTEIPIRCKGSRLVRFEDLKTFQGGLKELSQARADELRGQIVKLGWVSPVYVWGDNKLLDGHQRLNILPTLLEEGYTIGKIPVVDVDARSKTEAAKILLAINSRYGQITEEGLYEFMHEMELEAIDLDGIELPEIDIENFIDGWLEDNDEEDADDDVPDLPLNPQSKPGDIYQLSEHRVLCGDSTNTEDVARLMDGRKSDMVLTDPPYGNNLGYGRGQLGERHIAGDNNTELLKKMPQVIDGILKNNAHCLIWIQWRTFAALEKAFNQYKLRTVVVWDKKQAGLSGGGFAEQHEWLCVFIKGKATQSEYSGNVWQASREKAFSGRVAHPTMKPIEILSKAIGLCSSQFNIISDLFLGSGSTLIAAEKTGRVCYGMELDPAYVDVIVQRYVEYTEGGKVILNGKEIEWKS